MIDKPNGPPGVLTYLAVIAQVAFWTLGYYVVGLLPEFYHARKGNAWARINAYRWAAWHFRRYLTYSDDSVGRAALAWCYANLGMPETAVQHYRLAYARDRRPDVGCCLARAELATGGVAAARQLVAEIGARRDELSPELLPFFADVEAQVSAAGAGPEDGRVEHSQAVAPPPSDESIPVVRRLMRALMFAYGAFVTAFMLVNVAPVLSAGNTPARLTDLLGLALVVGVVFFAGVLVVHGPVLALTRAWRGNGLKALHAGLLGALLVPVPVVIFLSAFRVGGSDSPRGWAELMFRRPVVFSLWLTPFLLGGVVFAVVFAKNRLATRE